MLLLLMLAAFVVSFVVREEIFPYFSGNRDEPVYVFQAKTLLEGHLTLPAGENIEFFQPWLTGVDDGRIFFVFPPGWPAVLAMADLITGSMGVALAAVAALNVLGSFLFALEVFRDRRVALLSGAMMALAPIAIIQSGLYLSYLFTLALGMLFGFAILRGARTRSVPLLILAGVCLGAIFATRPLDAALWGVPFLGYLVIVNRRELVPILRRLLWCALGAAPLVLAILLYNTHVTGSPLRFGITAAEPLNGFGFGPRRIAPSSEPLDYTLGTALEASGTNFRNFAPWAFGNYLAIAGAIAGVVIKRRSSATWLLVALAAVFPVGYLYYWGIVLMADGSQGIGPQYYLPLYVVIAVLCSVTLVELWQRWRLAAAIGGAALIAITIPAIDTKLDINRGFTVGFSPPEKVLETAPRDNTLVFVPYNRDPYLLTSLVRAMNDPDMNGDILYALDLGAEDLDLVQDYPDRQPYLLTSELRDGDDIFHPTIFVQPLELVSGSTLEVGVSATNALDATAELVTYVEADGERAEKVVAGAAEPGSTFDVEWGLHAPGSAAPGDNSFELAEGSGTIVVGVAALEDDRGIDDELTERWERRIYYRVIDGEIALLLPGVGWQHFVFPGQSAWLKADITDVLEVSADAPSTP